MFLTCLRVSFVVFRDYQQMAVTELTTIILVGSADIIGVSKTVKSNIS